MQKTPLLPHYRDKAGVLLWRNVKAHSFAVTGEADLVERAVRRDGETGRRRVAAVHGTTNLHRVIHPGKSLELQLDPAIHTSLDQLRCHRVTEIRELDINGVTTIVRRLVCLE